MSTTRYVITDTEFSPTTLDPNHWVVQEGSHDTRRKGSPLLYEDLDEAYEYLDYVEASSASIVRTGGQVVRSPSAVTIFTSDGSIRVVRAVEA